MPEIGDGLWVTIGARIDGLQKGLADAKGSLTEWRDATNANTKVESDSKVAPKYQNAEKYDEHQIYYEDRPKREADTKT